MPRTAKRCASFAAGRRQSSASWTACGHGGSIRTTAAGSAERSRSCTAPSPTFRGSATTRCRSRVGGSSTNPVPRAPTRSPPASSRARRRARRPCAGLAADPAAGVIHADLFPDNVFFRAGEIVPALSISTSRAPIFLPMTSRSASTPGAFEADGSFNVTKATLCCSQLSTRRDLDTRRNSNALPILARGSALRFLLTRLYDRLNHPPGALVKPKDPLEYLAEAALPSRRHAQQQRLSASTRWPRHKRRRHGLRSTSTPDGACSGNPGPGGWGALLRAKGVVERALRRGQSDHQQPHGADGGDRRA